MKSPAHILIIDDDNDLRNSLALYLKIHFKKVSTLGDPQLINRALSSEAPDLVLLDMNFQQGRNDGREGLYWLRHLKEMRPEIMVLLITAYADIELAIESLKSGAADFIIKPWENQKLLTALLRAYELKHTKGKLKQFRQRQNKDGEQLRQLLEGSAIDPGSQHLLNQAQKVARTEASIYITGENGTGKSLLAHYIHLHSERSEEPFVSVDLGAIPEHLFESELFGHKKGAFTDAKEDRLGLVQSAQGGTLFLDEIGNCSLTHQQKLLRLIQDQSFQITGSSERQEADLRIIAASNADLPAEIEAGNFRQDLLYRINTIELHCLSLRERPGDLSFLIDYYLQLFNRRYQRELRLNASQIAEMKKHPWPGNIRELAHNIERAVILSENGHYAGSLCSPPKTQGKRAEDMPLDLDLETLEARHIQRVLRHYEGNMSKTAAHLGINRNTLYRKLDKYQFHDD